MPSRNEIEIVIKGDDQASEKLGSVLSLLGDMGKEMTKTGATITALTAPLAGGLALSVKSAIGFEESMTNVGAVLGKSRTEMESLNAQVLDIGRNSRAGPQAAANAFYDIVGGVADASSHMAILDAAIGTSEAGSAELGATTKALIAIMNSYKYEADDAAVVSDVLTRTVNKGVGTMDQFASALPSVTGLANSMGISFDDLASATAYLTTQGNTASGATTQLGAMMSALLNPNVKMKEGLKKLGFETGRAAVEQLGLVGAYQALTKEFGQDAIAPMTGSLEALRGVVALSGEEFTGFADDFKGGLEGATAAARELQLQSTAAQLDLLRSEISGLAVTVGSVLLPVIVQIVQGIRPLIERLADWMKANPVITATVIKLGAAISILGPALMTAGLVLSGIATAAGLVLSPLGLIVGVVAAVGAAFSTNFMGIRDVVMPIIDRIFGGFRRAAGGFSSWVDAVNDGGSIIDGAIVGISNAIAGFFLGADILNLDQFVALRNNLKSAMNGIVDTISGFTAPIRNIFGSINWADGFDWLLNGLGWFVEDVQNFGIADAIRSAFGMFDAGDGFESWIEGVLASFGMSREKAIAITQTVGNAVTGVLDVIEPLFSEVGTFISNFIGGLNFSSLAEVGTTIFNVATTLMSLTNPLGIVMNILKLFGISAMDIFSGILTAVTNFFAAINDGGTIWDGVKAAFGDTAFVNGLQTGFTGIVSFITDTVLPGLQNLANWFLTDVLPAVLGFIQGTVIPGIQTFIDTLGFIWQNVAPFLMQLGNWFLVDILPAVVGFVQTTVIPIIQFMIDTIGAIWTAVSPALGQLANWFLVSVLPSINAFLSGPVTTAVTGIISLLSGLWAVVSPGLTAFRDLIVNIFEWVINNAVQPFIDLVESIIGKIGEALTAIGNLTGAAGNALGTGAAIAGQVGQINELRQNVDPLQFLSVVGGSIANQFRAQGGPVSAGSPYIVGEQGPELFVPRQSGDIISNNDMGTSNITVIVNSVDEVRGATTNALEAVRDRQRSRGAAG